MVIPLQLPNQVAAGVQLYSPWFGIQLSEATGFHSIKVVLLHYAHVYGGYPGNQGP